MKEPTTLTIDKARPYVEMLREAVAEARSRTLTLIHNNCTFALLPSAPLVVAGVRCDAGRWWVGRRSRASPRRMTVIYERSRQVRIWSFRHASLGICAAAMLAGCGGSQPPIGALGAMPQSRAIDTRPSSTNYKVVYSFGAAPDGSFPEASLIDVGGTLYGTTYNGGSGSCNDRGVYGCGTVFAITTGGTEQVTYSFSNTPDGSNPRASLTDVAGALYGTTAQGGAHTCKNIGCGSVFSITTAGMEKVVYSFKPFQGAFPVAGLIDVDGTLYGTTKGGPGTVFSITPSGREKMLHKFGDPDGDSPQASLINVKGTLYGKTLVGGAYLYGTVFSITPSGTEKVLHSFDPGTDDGENPLASLIEVKGKLYGTTEVGGKHGYGTVFSITPGGTEKVLYSFKAPPDGEYPVASLIDVNGSLYGTTGSGGAYNCGGDFGRCGTVFSVTTSGTEKVVHSFSNAPDGFHPVANLTDVGGTLYGTTEYGGTSGSGTVFALTP
jgi:uncharacterized repeat protein (TIGR03803 family)